MQIKLWRAEVHYTGVIPSISTRSEMLRVYSYYARDRETSMHLLRNEIIESRYRKYIARINLQVVEGGR